MSVQRYTGEAAQTRADLYGKAMPPRNTVEPGKISGYDTTVGWLPEIACWLSLGELTAMLSRRGLNNRPVGSVTTLHLPARVCRKRTNMRPVSQCDRRHNLKTLTRAVSGREAKCTFRTGNVHKRDNRIQTGRNPVNKVTNCRPLWVDERRHESSPTSALACPSGRGSERHSVQSRALTQ